MCELSGPQNSHPDNEVLILVLADPGYILSKIQYGYKSAGFFRIHTVFNTSWKSILLNGFRFCLCVRPFICALKSPAGKGLTSWLSFVVSNCECVTFPSWVLGQVWYLIVSIPDLCTLTYFVCVHASHLSQQYFSHVRTFSCLPGLNTY